MAWLRRRRPLKIEERRRLGKELAALREKYQLSKEMWQEGGVMFPNCWLIPKIKALERKLGKQ